LLCCVAVAAGVVLDAEDAQVPSGDALAEALEACRQLSELADGLIEENARLRARDAERDAELEKLRADFTVLQRMVFGRSSERSRPEPPSGGDAAGDGGRGRERGQPRRMCGYSRRRRRFWVLPG
jgi:hypothetical protein